MAKKRTGPGKRSARKGSGAGRAGALGSQFDLDALWHRFREGIEDPTFRKFFNRDPERVTPVGEGLVVSPADGEVRVVRQKRHVEFVIKIGYLDVHIQRAPLAGRLERIAYSGTGHIKTGDPRHVKNYRASLTIQSDYGRYDLHMITGFSVRRLLVYLDPEDLVDTGDRVGRILFGSTAILRMPAAIVPAVTDGDRVLGGETVLGRFKRSDKKP